MAELMDLGTRLGPQTPQFLEAPMVEEECNVLEEIMADGVGALTEDFMINLNIQVPGDELQLYDVVFEDDDDDLFDLF